MTRSRHMIFLFMGLMVTLLFSDHIQAKQRGGDRHDSTHHEGLHKSLNNDPPVEHAPDPTPDQMLEDVIIGSGPIDLIVYGAFTCSHCAEFHLDVLPKIQEAYVDQGQVRLIVRDFPMDKASLAATVIARSRDKETYLRLAHFFFKNYESIVEHKTPLDQVKALAAQGGLTADHIKQALDNKELEDKVLNGVVYALNHYKIEATPTIIVGKKSINYAPSYEELKNVIESEIKRHKRHNRH